LNLKANAIINDKEFMFILEEGSVPVGSVQDHPKILVLENLKLIQVGFCCIREYRASVGEDRTNVRTVQRQQAQVRIDDYQCLDNRPKVFHRSLRHICCLLSVSCSHLIQASMKNRKSEKHSLNRIHFPASWLGVLQASFSAVEVKSMDFMTQSDLKKES
jgi:hypothetical protein